MDEEEWITFHIKNQEFDITLDEWCNHFGFINNNDDARYVYKLPWPQVKGQLHPKSCYSIFYYVITNLLQEGEDVSKVNDENMLILGKVGNLDVGYLPNLGAILLLTSRIK